MPCRLKQIKHTFDERYCKWGIEMPTEHLLGRTSGSIFKNGWTIRYTFVCQDDQEFCIVFQNNPVAWASLYRINLEGDIESLGFQQQIPHDNESMEAFRRHNREFWDLARSYGLLDCLPP